MQSVSVERDPPLRLTRLDTGAGNPLTLEAVRSLTKALAPDPEAPVVVLTGRADGFCVGLDNATLAKGRLKREELLAAMGELLLAALRAPTRIVAACEGHAVAAGAMLLLVSDVRVGTRDEYKVGFTEVGLGMPLPELPAALARERLDRKSLHSLTVLGRTVTPEGALEAGFFDELVAREDLQRTAHARAQEIAGLSEAAYQGTMASVRGRAIERISELVTAQLARFDAVRAGAA